MDNQIETGHLKCPITYEDDNYSYKFSRNGFEAKSSRTKIGKVALAIKERIADGSLCDHAEELMFAAQTQFSSDTSIAEYIQEDGKSMKLSEASRFVESTLSALEAMQRRCDIKEDWMLPVELNIMKRFGVAELDLHSFPCVSPLCTDKRKKSSILISIKVISGLIATLIASLSGSWKGIQRLLKTVRRHKVIVSDEEANMPTITESINFKRVFASKRLVMAGAFLVQLTIIAAPMNKLVGLYCDDHYF